MFRLIHDDAHDGPTNMARDESLLEEVGVGNSPPTLRLYTWDPPTISLGYFQRYADYETLPPPAGTLAVVRRQTGGGAILHDKELTYSITVPIDHPLVMGNHTQLYSVAHNALIHTLNSLGLDTQMAGITDQSTPTHGPFFCFARRHELDVVLGEGKLAGSAQRVTRNAILQHGSIMLGRRFDQQPVAAIHDASSASLDTLISAWLDALAESTSETFTPGDWTEQELTRACVIRDKYASDEWTRKR